MAKRGFVGLKVTYTKPIFFKLKDTFHEEFLVSTKRYSTLVKQARLKQRAQAARTLELGKGAKVKTLVTIPQSRLDRSFLGNLHTLK